MSTMSTPLECRSTTSSGTPDAWRVPVWCAEIQNLERGAAALDETENLARRLIARPAIGDAPPVIGDAAHLQLIHGAVRVCCSSPNPPDTNSPEDGEDGDGTSFRPEIRF